MKTEPSRARERTVVTRVGYTGDGENFFRGRRVSKQLAGRMGVWSLLSIATGSEPLSRAEERVWDDVSSCILAPDPRIWLFKLTQVVAASGGIHSGVAIGALAGSSALVGPNAVRGCFELLDEARRTRNDERLHQRLAERAAARQLPGFGTPLRTEDERLGWLIEVARKRRITNKPHWRAFERVRRVARDAVKPRPNVGLCIAAIGMDQGLSVDSVEMLTYVAILPQYVAHAFEASKERPQLLRELPEELTTA